MATHYFIICLHTLIHPRIQSFQYHINHTYTEILLSPSIYYELLHTSYTFLLMVPTHFLLMVPTHFHWRFLHISINWFIPTVICFFLEDNKLPLELGVFECKLLEILNKQFLLYIAVHWIQCSLLFTLKIVLLITQCACNSYFFSHKFWSYQTPPIAKSCSNTSAHAANTI